MHKALLYNHQIIKQQIVVEFDDESKAMILQQRLSNLCNHILPPFLETLFDKYFPGSILVTINSLEIGLQSLSVTQSDSEWVALICDQLEKELSLRIISLAESKTNPDQDLFGDEVELLIFYFRYGVLPYWSNLKGKRKYLSELFAKIIKSNSAIFYEKLRLYQNEQGLLLRLANQASDAELMIIVCGLLTDQTQAEELAGLYSAGSARNDWLIIQLYLAESKDIPAFKTTARNIFRHLYTNEFDFLIAEIVRLLPGQLEVSKLVALSSDDAFAKIGRALFPSWIEQALIARQIVNSEIGTWSNQLTGILIRFYRQVELENPANLVSVLRKQVSELSGFDNGRYRTFLNKLKEIADRPQFGSDGNLFFDSLMLLCGESSLKKTSNSEDLSISDQPDPLIYFLINRQWPAKKSLKEQIAHIRNIKGLSFRQLQPVVIGHLKDHSLVDWLVKEVNEGILIQIIPFLAGDRALLKHKEINYVFNSLLNVSLNTSVRSDKSNLKITFWHTTFSYLLSDPRPSYYQYIRFIMKVFSTSYGIPETEIADQILTYCKTKNIVPLNRLIASLRLLKGYWSHPKMAPGVSIKPGNSNRPVSGENIIASPSGQDESVLSNGKYENWISDSASENFLPNGDSQNVLGDYKGENTSLNLEEKNDLAGRYSQKTTSDDGEEYDYRGENPVPEDKDEIAEIRNISGLLIGDDADTSPVQKLFPEELFIDNAGIVILYPFISIYLDRLGLLAGVKEKDISDQLKAIHALQYLVTGKQNHQEYELLFIKVLCDFPLDKAYQKQKRLSKSARDIAEGLLNHILTLWSAIGGTSIEGLRTTFLQRNAKLNFTKEAIYLNVEAKPFDILLDHLPWSIELLNFSWMDRNIHVLWRK